MNVSLTKETFNTVTVTDKTIPIKLGIQTDRHMNISLTKDTFNNLFLSISVQNGRSYSRERITADS
jgi:hypothetical protein